MKVAVAKESYPEERRVALVPAAIKPLVKKGVEVLIETGAGVAAGFSDDAYREAGADDRHAGRCLCRRLPAGGPHLRRWW